jgi:hypothetical protein
MNKTQMNKTQMNKTQMNKTQMARTSILVDDIFEHQGLVLTGRRLPPALAPETPV